MNGRTRPIGLLTLGLLALAPAGASATTTFGADLSQPADATFLCEHPPFVPAIILFPPTCTVFTAGTLGTSSRSHLVPSGRGVVTAVRIRQGPQTGPMKITVLRALRHPQSLADPVCCTVVGESQAFTPAPNAVSEIPVNLPVKSEITSTGVYEFDQIALSALSATTPIPGAFASDAASGGWWPSLNDGQEAFAGQTALGPMWILMEADWEPDATAGQGGGGGTPPGGGPPVLGAPPVTIDPSRARVSGGAATIPLACALDRACAGLLRLQSRAQAGAVTASKRKPKTRTYGSRSFSIPAGRSGSVKVRLNAAGRRQLRRKRKLSVWVNATVGSGASKQVVARRVTLRARAKRRG